jgi:hypothetical protein
MDFLHKPFTREQLATKVREVLGSGHVAAGRDILIRYGNSHVKRYRITAPDGMSPPLWRFSRRMRTSMRT